MPGHFQIPLDKLQYEVDELLRLGIKSIILFGVPESKDATGSDSLHDHGIIQEAIKMIRAHSSDLLIISDICFCEYTDHGHCGFLSERRGKLDVGQ